MKRRGEIVAWLAVGLLTAAPAAAGTRQNNFSGATCLKSAGNATPRYSQLGVTNQTSNEWLHLACPFPMSVGGKFFLPSAAKLADSGSNCSSGSGGGSVTFIDLSTTQNVSCTLYVLGSGNAVLASFTVSSSGASSNPQSRTFGIPSMDFTKKTLFAQCVVPPPDAGQRSSVLNFIVTSCDL
jgi:hypothetical protein